MCRCKQEVVDPVWSLTLALVGILSVDVVQAEASMDTSEVAK